MKGFFTGLLVFIVYALGCIALLSYVKEEIPSWKSAMTVQENLEAETPDSSQISVDEWETVTVPDTLQVTVELDSLTGENSTSIENEYDQSEYEKASNNAENFVAPKFNVALPNGRLLLDCDELATIYKDRSRVKIPYSCWAYGVAIKEFLDANPLTLLKITGYGDPSEAITIGKERAAYIKRLLTNAGIEESRILATSAIGPLNFQNGAATGGLVMQINGTMSDGTTNAAPPKSKDNNQTQTKTSTSNGEVLSSKTIVSGFQGSYFYGDQRFTSYVNTIQNLLNDNPAAKVYAYSYTNSEGNPKDNFAISRDNASTVRKILLQSGISASRIQSIAKGSQASSVSNGQRIVIVVK